MRDPVQEGETKRQREAWEKLEAIRRAMEHSFPTGDIEDMLAEIDRGRQE